MTLPRYSCIVYKGMVLNIPLRLYPDHGIRHLPLQMFDEHGAPIPQPYPDTEEMQSLRGINTDPALWFLDLENLPSDITDEDLHPDEWQETQYDTDCKCFDPHTRKVVLIPGHTKNARGRVERDSTRLERSHVAFGGMAVYEVKAGQPDDTQSALLRKGTDVLKALAQSLEDAEKQKKKIA